MRFADHGSWMAGGNSWRTRSPWVRASLLVWAASLFAVLSVQGFAAQECAINWRQVYSPLILNDMAYDGHTFVGVGNGGLVVTSPDGLAWTQRPCHLDADLSTIVAGNGRFVVSGMAYPGGPPVTMTSPDGIEWSIVWYPSGQAVQFSGGLFFSGHMTSPDGRQWTPYYLPMWEDFSSPVAHGNGTWLGVQLGSSFASSVYTSADGRVWRVMPLPPFGSVATLVFGGGRFVVQAGAIYSSMDGSAWTKSTSGPQFNGPMVYAGTQFVIVKQGETWFSKDGQTWKRKTSDMSVDARVFRLFWTGNGLVAFGDRLGTQCTFESSDGLHWTSHPLCSDSSGSSGMVRYFEEPGLFVSAGNLKTSTDGDHWIEPTTPDSASAVAHGDGTFVAVGTRGRALWSYDARTWTPVATGFPEDLYDVAYGAGLFVAVGGRGRVITSPDGKTWTIRYSFFYGDLTSIVFAEGTFLTVGYNSSPGLVSSDGITWQNVDLLMNFLSYPGPTASYALGHFLVASPDGLVGSDDGRTWTYLGSPFISGNAVEWNGRAYAPGGSSSGVLTSDDLQTWTPVHTNGLDRVFQGRSLATDGSFLVLSGDRPGLLKGTKAPLVATVTPERIPVGESSTVWIEGTGFTSVTQVRFGEMPATSFTVLSDDAIEAVAPPLPADTLTITADAEDEPCIVARQAVLQVRGTPVIYGACPTVMSVAPSYYYRVYIWGKGLSEVTDFTAAGAFIGGRWGGGEDYCDYWIWPTVEGPSAAEVTLSDGSTQPVPGGLIFVAPPVVTAVKVIRNPFQIKVTGTGFTEDYAASINGAVLALKFKSPTSLSISGSALAKYLNPGTNYLKLVSCVGSVYSNEFPFYK